MSTQTSLPIPMPPSLEERIRQIVEEEWADKCPWAQRPAVTRSPGGIAVIFRAEAWDEFEDEESARRVLQHEASRIRKESRK